MPKAMERDGTAAATTTDPFGGLFVKPENITPVILFLASDASKAI